MFWHGAACAALVNVAVVLSDESAPYQEAARSLAATLKQASANATVGLFSSAELTSGTGKELPGLVVAIGARAAQDVAAKNLNVPVLAILLPRQSFEKIPRTKNAGHLSAIYLDQPLSRQMKLIRIVFPQKTKIGALLGPDSHDALKAVQTASREAGLSLVTEKISSADELLPGLQRVLADSEVLLALPDSLVYNKGTVQSLLLTTYRYQNPMIGFSQAYVRAGALAAVYSTPEQAGRQAGEMVARALESASVTLPAPVYPKYFAVSVNYQVARSLGMSVGEEAQIYKQLQAEAGTE
jgi:putative ABC transport system substrate-binding protein